MSRDNASYTLRQLREQAQMVRPYPNGLMAEGTRDTLPHTLWFPFGRGVENPDGPFPHGGTMVVGQDWGTQDYLDEDMNRAALGEHFSWEAYPTTKRIQHLLQDVELNPRTCFFTNAFLGVRHSAIPTGPCPGWKDAAFTGRCKKFLVLQIQVQRPTVIVLLGKEVARFVADLSRDLTPWRSAETFRDIDSGAPDQTGAVRRATFHDAQNHVAIVVALTHPCFPNGRWRSYKGHHKQAEQRMLRDALARGTTLPVT